eukprot:CAMPEP_0114434314 /NCGR_PEP_ID=MMETSP0103-20121206/12193_1 /TAXON_ID=37642 ORGANISM="Paraphysomonas imperforata, Strain PA2" /NCGR_SAMPLE_ID=MMETSP0103 /ASSEMBLY_ACC=CAM_ASM_000201 /LENGTH=196 /DNA_ID=CAMNT_0001604189 /DNA_START=548 /DNA_END=1138 /DNA_ORIENTATION=-
MAALPVTSSATEKTSEDEKKQQKVSMPLEASEELVNLARADLRSACCLICMVEAPTLSTLCCGQPVHFSCLCNWLTSRRHTGASIDCPHCRCDMSEPNVSPPEPPRRVGVEMSGSDSGSEDSDDSSSTIDFFDLISDGNESIEEGDSSGSGSGEYDERRCSLFLTRLWIKVSNVVCMSQGEYVFNFKECSRYHTIL